MCVLVSIVFGINRTRTAAPVRTLHDGPESETQIRLWKLFQGTVSKVMVPQMGQKWAKWFPVCRSISRSSIQLWCSHDLINHEDDLLNLPPSKAGIEARGRVMALASCVQALWDTLVVKIKRVEYRMVRGGWFAAWTWYNSPWAVSSSASWAR